MGWFVGYMGIGLILMVAMTIYMAGELRARRAPLGRFLVGWLLCWPLGIALFDRYRRKYKRASGEDSIMDEWRGRPRLIEIRGTLRALSSLVV
jgi:hypothetical protein